MLKYFLFSRLDKILNLKYGRSYTLIVDSKLTMYIRMIENHIVLFTLDVAIIN
jgi:hypothetical protein